MEEETLSDHKYISFAIYIDKRARAIYKKKKYVR